MSNPAIDQLLSLGVPMLFTLAGVVLACRLFFNKIGPFVFREDTREVTIAAGAGLLLIGFVWIVAEQRAIPSHQKGEAKIEFAGKSSMAGSVSFPSPFSRIPIVLVSECKARGHFLIVKTDEVSETGFIWAAAQQDGQPITYESKLCWVAFDAP